MKEKYKVKAVVQDVEYTYQGYPHRDEEIEMSVWNGDQQVPIGEIVKVVHYAGEEYGCQHAALTEKYGQSFATKFLGAFGEGWWPLPDDESALVFARLSLCNRETTEVILRELRNDKVEVEDLRSKESRVLSADIMKLMSDDSGFVAEELAKREKAGALSRAEVVAALMEMYGVCQDAAAWYTGTYCEYKFSDRGGRA